MAEVVSQVDLNSLFGAAVAESSRRQSDSSTAFLQALDRQFLRIYSEVDPVQAAAIRGISYRESPINPTAPA